MRYLYSHNRRASLFCRVLVWLVIFSFIFSDLGWTFSALNPSEIHTPELAKQITIPSSIGHIKEVFTSQYPETSTATIVFIEDAHSHYYAQKNIKKILKHLEENFDFKNLFLEGAIGRLEPKQIDFLENEKLNKKLLDKLTEKGIVGGVELFLFDEYKNKKDFSGFGVEDIELYKKELKIFRDVYKREKFAKEFLAKIKTRIMTLGSKNFNKELKDFFREWIFHEEIENNILSNLAFLRKFATDTLKIDLSNAREQYDWPQLVRFFKLQELEKALAKADKRKTDDEEKKLFNWLKSNGFNGYLPIFSGDLEAKEKRESTRDLLEEFYEKTNKKGFSFKDYPNFSKRMGMLILENEIRTDELMSEVKDITNLILNSLAKTKKEKELVLIYKDYLSLKKLFSLELANAEYKELLGRGDNLEPKKMLSRLNITGKKATLLQKKINKLFLLAKEFYSVAKMREEVIFKNMISVMKNSKESNGILVAGGFHSEGLSNLFKDNGISYVCVSPHIQELTNDHAYLNVMTLGVNSPAQKSYARLPSAITLNLQRYFPEYGEYYRSEVRATMEEMSNVSLRAQQSNVKRQPEKQRDEGSHQIATAPTLKRGIKGDLKTLKVQARSEMRHGSEKP